jgi:hypothetical protein
LPNSTHRAVNAVGRDDVGEAVVIEIPYRHGLRAVPDGVSNGRLEAAVAIAQQYIHGAALKPGHGNVEDAVPVKVPGDYRRTHKAQVDGALEGTVTVSEQELPMFRDYVQDTIAREIANRQ